MSQERPIHPRNYGLPKKGIHRTLPLPNLQKCEKMNLLKAIEILDIRPGQNSFFLTPNRLEAMLLGIEALKRLIFNRLNTIAGSDELLPGETPEPPPSDSLAKPLRTR